MKKVFNKKNLLFLITTVCLVGLIGIGASYAYYLANFSVSNPENANNNLTTTSTTDVVMDMQGKYAPSNTVPGFKGVKEVVVRGLGEKNSAPSEASIQITPDFADFGNDVTWKLYKSDTPITCTSNVNEGMQYYDEAICDIPKSASLLLEGGAESDYLNITVNPLTETKYYLVVEYANNGDQSSQMGKSFSVTIGLGNKVKNPIKDIIAQLDTTDKCPSVNDDGSANVTGAEATDGYLCKAKDVYGTSYYYRGNVTNNYVKFADKYWRIVRINGDGTVRVIYDGTSAHANGESSSDRHANTNDSTIKAYIDDWYKKNILGTVNEQYLADNIFCNDRSISGGKPYDSYSNLGYGTEKTTYRWNYGPWESAVYNSSMKLVCPQQNDAFTVSDTTNGNGALTYPIGLLSTDEIVLAGGWNKENSGYYLYSGQIWLVSSPYSFNGSDAVVRFVDDSEDNANASGLAHGVAEVRPVLNLKAEVLTYGDGTMNNPYRLTETIDSTASSGGGSSAIGGIDEGPGSIGEGL